MDILVFVLDHKFQIWFVGTIFLLVLCIASLIRGELAKDEVLSCVFWALMWPGIFPMLLIMGVFLIGIMAIMFGPEAYRDWRDRPESKRPAINPGGYRDPAP
jgi:uncharacterized integral membrane protein